jgi:hypothetical protein
MAYTSTKRNLQEKPTYDTAVYTYDHSLSAIGANLEDLKLNPSSKSKSPDTAPAKAPTTPLNKYSYYSSSPSPEKPSPEKDKPKPEWNQFQKDYASDYMARVRVRCLA